MSDLRKKYAARFPHISARGLKNFAVIIMLLVNTSTIILEKGLIQLDTYTQAELLDAMDATPNLVYLAGIDSVIQLLAGLAVPIFAFLLVEGFLHTGDYVKYLIRVAVVALISEIAYDFAMTGKFLEFSQQNPMVALAICLIMLYFMRAVDHMAAVERIICHILLTLCAAFWVIIVHTEYGLEMVLLAAVFYCFRDKTAVKILLGILISLIDPTGPLAFCGIAYYSGERKLKLSKYVYYVLYPLHLLVLGVITRCFLL